MKDNVVSVIRVVLSLAVAVLAVLQLIGVWENAIYVYEPLMGVVLLFQAYYFRNRSRGLAIFSLCTAVIVLVGALVILFVR